MWTFEFEYISNEFRGCKVQLFISHIFHQKVDRFSSEDVKVSRKATWKPHDMHDLMICKIVWKKKAYTTQTPPYFACHGVMRFPDSRQSSPWYTTSLHFSLDLPIIHLLWKTESHVMSHFSVSAMIFTLSCFIFFVLPQQVVGINSKPIPDDPSQTVKIKITGKSIHSPVGSEKNRFLIVYSLFTFSEVFGFFKLHFIF